MNIHSSAPEYNMNIAEFDSAERLKNARRQAEQKGLDDVLIIDADSHHYETENLLEIIEYIQDPVIRQLARASAQYQGTSGMIQNSVGFQDMGGRIPRYVMRRHEKQAPASTMSRPTELSLRWMDAIGIDYACLFPTPMLQLGMHPQVDMEIALSGAYNRWLVERVLSESPRLKSMLYLPFNDPEASYRMVKEFAGKPGVIGFLVVATRYKPVYANEYMKTYALLEETGLPLAFHASNQWGDRLISLTNRFLVAHALGFTLFNAVHLSNWVINGLPERFPKLKVVWIESGLAWVPWLMQRLDNEYRMRSSEAPALKRLPSDYMREMYYTTQPMEMVNNDEALQLTFKMINAETQLLYASDYPHWDMDLPSTIWDMPFLSEDAKRNILGRNAQRLFGIDVAERFPATRKQEELA
jgi:predicted TIM-barrel fold metal-dependent hydrolase